MVVLWALAGSALAALSEPGVTAVDFLEKVRAKNLNLDPGGDTALAAQTTGPKRLEIARRLERMARDLGREPLEVGPVKLDDDLAAVLVRKIGGFNPADMQVFPVALVKRGTRWAASPVPASFENSGVRHTTSLRNRLTILENWMLREQCLELENLRDQSAERLRQKIHESLPPATVRGFTAQQAADRFLAACRQRNLPEMLGLLGGLSAPLPDDWPLRLRSAERAVNAARAVHRPWRLLMADEVLRTRALPEGDGENVRISIACLDPAGCPLPTTQPRVELVALELIKTPDGGWRIDPPDDFFSDGENPDRVADEHLDAELLKQFPRQLAELYPPAPRATADQARHDLFAALQTENPTALMRLIRLDADPIVARQSCLRAASLWWSLREPLGVHSVLPLATMAHGDVSAHACQVFSAQHPERLDLRILYFEKSPNGWCWAPEPCPESKASCLTWSNNQSLRWPKEWIQTALTDSVLLEDFPLSEAPADEASRKLVASWQQAIRAGDLVAALRFTARLSTPDSNATLLQNLGYEMTAAHLKSQSPTITHVFRGSHCAAVATRTEVGNDRRCPLYPVVATPAGPRILLEIDLLASPNRSRDFLNKAALARLRAFSELAADDLATLMTQHQAKTE